MRGACVAALLLLAAPAPAFAWGAAGHRMIGELAVRHFPAEIPAFLRTPQAAARIGLLAQEPDLSRGAGQPHDWDSDPGHFVDLLDDGTVLGGPALDALPPSRRDYDTALRAVQADQYKGGYLPYNLMDGWQQLVKDFALLRRDRAALKFAKKYAMTPAQRRRYAASLRLREMLTLRDLGVWAHYVGDASQPLHVSVHYDGWGDYPNPQGFTARKGFHAKFESDFVAAHVRPADVAALMTRPYAPDSAIQAHVARYLGASFAQVATAYAFEQRGEYDAATPAARRFAAARIAEGALTLRDMVTDAWRASGAATLGYKTILTVADIEAGRADPRRLD